MTDAGPDSGTPAVGAVDRGGRPGGPARPSPQDLALDLLAVVTVLPVLGALWLAVRGAWQVYHPPVRPVRQKPETFGLVAERVMVPGADGLPLACWWIPAAGPADAVVIGHGIRRDSGSVMALAKRMHDAGYHVLTFDMRNHGESAQDHLLRGQSTLTAVDHHRVVQYVGGRPELAGRKVALVGFSMTSWTSMWAARREPELVRAVICDSGPSADMVRSIGRTYDVARPKMPRLLRGPILFWIGKSAFTWASAWLFQIAEWPQLLPDPTVPVLFVVGERDPVVRPDHVRKQMAYYPGSTLWVVPRAGHTTSIVVALDEFVQRVLALLEQASFTPADRLPTKSTDASGS